MTTNPTDLDQLRAQYPDWDIRECWHTRTSGPDYRMLHATCGELFISAYDVPGLARALRQTAGEPKTDVELAACLLVAAKPERVGTVHNILARYRAGRMTPEAAMAYLDGAS